MSREDKGYEETTEESLPVQIARLPSNLPPLIQEKSSTKEWDNYLPIKLGNNNFNELEILYTITKDVLRLKVKYQDETTETSHKHKNGRLVMSKNSVHCRDGVCIIETVVVKLIRISICYYPQLWNGKSIPVMIKLVKSIYDEFTPRGILDIINKVNGL